MLNGFEVAESGGEKARSVSCLRERFVDMQGTGI
jgi:hypothetical protein